LFDTYTLAWTAENEVFSYWHMWWKSSSHERSLLMLKVLTTSDVHVLEVIPYISGCRHGEVLQYRSNTLPINP
jgi:hypothetical protein